MAAQDTKIENVAYHTLLEGPSDPTAPCVLIVHALMSNMHMWDATALTLHAAGFRTLRFDHIGHHKTPAPQPQTPYHMDDVTRHMHSIVTARTGSDKIRAVAGCSIGGVLALRYAMLFPYDVEQIVSVAAPGIKAFEDKNALWTRRIELFEKDQQAVTEELCQQTVERWVPGGRTEDDSVRAEALKHVRTCSLEGYKIMADTIRSYDYEGEEGKVAGTKCLIAGGTEDGACSLSHLREVAGKISGAEFMEIEKAGHLPPMQKPVEFGELLLRFLGDP